MKNVVLVRGKCSICGGKIDEDWAGKDPSLGTKCRTCSYKDPEPQLFTPEHIEFPVDILLGKWDNDLEWTGTKIMVNGKVGIINSTQGDLAWVDFGQGGILGEPIKGLGHWDLLRIYSET